MLSAAGKAIALEAIAPVIGSVGAHEGNPEDGGAPGTAHEFTNTAYSRQASPGFSVTAGSLFSDADLSFNVEDGEFSWISLWTSAGVYLGCGELDDPQTVTAATIVAVTVRVGLP